MLPYEPLKLYIPVATFFYPFPIHSLRIVATGAHIRSISRILNSLKENGYPTIGHVLNASLNDLAKTRNFAERGQFIILGLLQKLSDQAELFMDPEKLEPKLRLEVDRIKRIESILKRLRDMGMIE